MSARALGGLAALLFGVALLLDSGRDWVARTELPPLVPETGVEVLDREGRLLQVYTVAGGRWRLALSPEAVDPRFITMLLRYEDKRFWSHGGIDMLALLRAAGQAARAGRVVSGGSTLTMQVARLLESGPTGSWTGKLRQMRAALALEARLSKREILALYLHLAPYGGNTEGLRAATLAWFGKPPRLLSAEEAALLIALPQGPESRRPDRHPEAAKRARDRVLARLSAAGALAPDLVERARARPVPARRRAMPDHARLLAARLVSADPLARRIETRLDLRLQAAFEGLARDALRAAPDGVSVALLLADHQSGEILASVGAASADGAGGFVDMTQAPRSPGSTLKPLVYGLAFDAGLAHPETLIHDGPVQFGRYAPQNFDGAFRGDVTVREALQMSLNIPVVRLTEALGPAHLMAGLRRSGAVPRLAGTPGLAVALGGVGLTLEELVQLYAGLASEGNARSLSALAQPDLPRARLISRAAAWQVSDILGGIAPPRGMAPGRLAYKTGTSYGHRDAWAIGYDGRYVLGVWMGRPDGTPVPGAFGGDLAAPVLFRARDLIGEAMLPRRAAPPEVLTVGNAALPRPLRRFSNRQDSAPDPEAPRLIFPPEGAQFAHGTEAITVKIRAGAPPYTVLLNGAPVLRGARSRELRVPGLAPGHMRLTVIDAEGRADRREIEIR